MPVSWKGTLKQYAGRLHREHATKTGVRIIDFVDAGHAALLRMWGKRQRGYRTMGYKIRELTTESVGMEFGTTANDDKQCRIEHYKPPTARINGGA